MIRCDIFNVKDDQYHYTRDDIDRKCSLLKANTIVPIFDQDITKYVFLSEDILYMSDSNATRYKYWLDKYGFYTYYSTLNIMDPKPPHGQKGYMYLWYIKHGNDHRLVANNKRPYRALFNNKGLFLRYLPCYKLYTSEIEERIGTIEDIENYLASLGAEKLEEYVHTPAWDS